MNSFPHLRRWLTSAVTILVLAGTLVIAAARKADDDKPAREAGTHTWPLYGGSLQRNMVNTVEKDIPAEWSVEEGNQKNIKWVAELGSKAYGGPAIADGRVFIGTNNKKPRDPKITGDKGVIMCFREADGKFLWQAIHDKLPAGRVNDWPEEGICSTPVIDGDHIYYVNNRCEVVCATTRGNPSQHTAEIVWRLDMIKDLDVFPHNLATCSPLIAGDRLFVITSNGVDEGHINIPQPSAPSFLMVDKKTGKVLWKDNSPGEKIMHGQWSNPVYAEVEGKAQVIYPGGDGWLRSFDPQSGKLIWKFDANPKNSKYLLGGRGTRNDFLATPVVHDNKVYIGVGQDPEHDEGIGHFWCIDITKEGDVSPVNDNFDPKDPVNKNSALVWHFGGAATDPRKTGRNYNFGRTLSTVAVHDGLAYVAELAGYIHCLDAKTGKKYWDHDMKAKTWSSPYWVDGKVYMGNDDGRILVFQHGKDKNLLGEIDMEGKVRSTPVAVNGVLYVMTENKLYAIQNQKNANDAK
jgi:outer membrane protein assembly factor BamB